MSQRQHFRFGQIAFTSDDDSISLFLDSREPISQKYIERAEFLDLRPIFIQAFQGKPLSDHTPWNPLALYIGRAYPGE